MTCIWLFVEITKVKVELISYPEMYQCIGGIFNLGNLRYAKANNEYVKVYDETKQKKYLLFVNSNKIYGESMM